MAGLGTAAAFLARILSHGRFDIARGAPELLAQIPFAPALVKAIGGPSVLAPYGYVIVFAALCLPLLGVTAAMRAPKRVETAPPGDPLSRQSSLSELLVSVADKGDAWRRFGEPVELVGRDGELERLADFA